MRESHFCQMRTSWYHQETQYGGFFDLSQLRNSRVLMERCRSMVIPTLTNVLLKLIGQYSQAFNYGNVTEPLEVELRVLILKY